MNDNATPAKVRMTDGLDVCPIDATDLERLNANTAIRGL